MKNGNTVKECAFCHTKSFQIEHRSTCVDCESNGAYDSDDDEYIYNEYCINQLELDRDEVQNSSECEIGSAWGHGCEYITCVNCSRYNYNIAWTDWG